MNNMSAVLNPFASSEPQKSSGALAKSDQHRALAEIQGRLMIARANPRSPVAAVDRILNACTRIGLAEAAIYQYARGGTDISGPSIRLAEAIGQEWTNMEFGFRELYRGVGDDGVTFSEIEAFAWDLEKNTRRSVTFRIRHWRDRKNGAGYRLTDERDIYELTANMAQRRVRACILAIVPGDVVEAAVNQCELTLNTRADTSAEAMQKLVSAFSALGITQQQIEKRIQRRLDSIQPAQVVSLRKIYASLRDDMSKPGDWFELVEKDEAKEPPKSVRETIKDYMDIRKPKAAPPKPEPKPEESRDDQSNRGDDPNNPSVNPETGEIMASPAYLDWMADTPTLETKEQNHERNKT